MKLTGMLFVMLFFNLKPSFSQHKQSLWNAYYPGGIDMVSKMLYPFDKRNKRELGFAIQSYAAYNFSNTWILAYTQNIPKTAGILQLGLSSFSIGPYQEHSFRMLIGRQFGPELFIWLQPEYHQSRVRAYGKRGGFIYSGAVGYKNKDWFIGAFFGKYIGQEKTKNQLQFSWTYALSKQAHLGLNMNKQSGLAWQTTLDLSIQITPLQRLGIGAYGRNSFFLRYENRKNLWNLLIAFHYSSMIGMYPVNAAGHEF